MLKKTILLITDSAPVEQAVENVLTDYAVEMAGTVEAAAETLHKKKPALIIIDYDLKKVDGLQVFRQIQPLAPNSRTIMLSGSNDIPLAVTATKLGAADFLKKPILPKDLIASVEKNIKSAEPFLQLSWLKEAPSGLRNVILLAERGINKEEAAQFIHKKSAGLRPLKIIDASAFRRENLESSFWASLRPKEDERSGTLFLDNLDVLDEAFRASIFEFFKEKKDRQIILGLYSREALRQVPVKHYDLIEIPPLRVRKNELLQLISRQLTDLAALHNKNVRAVSAEVLSLLSAYDFPGNFAELECLLEEAVLISKGDILELADLPLDFRNMKEIAVKKNEPAGLLAASRWFEKFIYKTLLKKNGEDFSSAARFLDTPKTVLVERVEELGAGLLD